MATLALTLFDIDMVTALSATASTLGNVGPGLGEVGPYDDYAGYAGLPQTAKWLLSAWMLLGRLEFSALLVMCLPAFWKP